MPTSSGTSAYSYNKSYSNTRTSSPGMVSTRSQYMGTSSDRNKRISVSDLPSTSTGRYTTIGNKVKYSSGGNSSSPVKNLSSHLNELHLDPNNNRTYTDPYSHNRYTSSTYGTYSSSKPSGSNQMQDYHKHGNNSHTTHIYNRTSVYTPPSRSSSVDSNSLTPSHSRASQFTIAAQNKNDSCGSHGSSSELLQSQKSSGSVTEQGNVGLSNLGNTCFMNSVLQCLLNCKHLKDYILTEEYVRDINKTTSSMKGALVEVFSELMKKVWSRKPPSTIAPKDLKTKIQRFAPRFGGYNQQDAQEFLRYFLEGLHEDVNRVRTKPKYRGCDEKAEERMSDEEKAAEYWDRYLNFDNSAIVDAFVGQLKSTLTCQTCGYKSVTFDPFWDLSIPIPKNRYQDVDIQDCVESFMKEETLDGDEKPTCARCKTRRKCTKSFKIQRLPKILVLHLKRFSGERFRQKLSTKVAFDVKDFTLRNFTVDSSQKAAYNLFGISNHVGSVYSGHYTAYCKHPSDGKWYSFNDSQVSRISEKQLVSEEAYVLFYELA